MKAGILSLLKTLLKSTFEKAPPRRAGTVPQLKSTFKKAPPRPAGTVPQHLPLPFLELSPSQTCPSQTKTLRHGYVCFAPSILSAPRDPRVTRACPSDTLPEAASISPAGCNLSFLSACGLLHSLFCAHCLMLCIFFFPARL